MSPRKGDRPEMRSKDPKFALDHFQTVTRCVARNREGVRCKIVALPGSLYCRSHSGSAPTRA